MDTNQTGNNIQNEVKRFCFDGFWAWLIEIAFYSCLAIIIIYLIRRIIEGPFYCKQNRIDGKVVIVTGCNTGIGKETALELAKRGARVYMACRDAARCEAARLEIIARSQNSNVFNRTLDLSSLSSVRHFAKCFIEEENRLDILINNAGIMATPRLLTEDGFEQQFGVNHLGHFLLTNLLLNYLKKSAPSRIIVVSSLAYVFGRICKNDLMSEKRYSRFFGAYAQSKLANILFARKLSKLLKDSRVTVNCLHPGIVRTSLTRYDRFLHGLQLVFNLMFRSPKAGAQTTLYLALDPKFDHISGGYYAHMLKFPLLPRARDKQTADWLWDESMRLVGLHRMKEQESESTVTSELQIVKETKTEQCGITK